MHVVMVGVVQSWMCHLACVVVALQSEEFRDAVFEVVPARDYQAVSTLADAGVGAGVELERLASAAQQECQQNRQTTKLMQGSTVQFGSRVQVGALWQHARDGHATACRGAALVLHCARV